jgi:hypothetical protein
METTLDRITLNFGPTELTLARELRKRAGERGLNALIKRVLREWIATQKP